jgi:catechol 2,3-dioxygenase-like lactoylglutathione lyase family enzyme
MSDTKKITAVRVVAVPVTDQDRAVAFYTERLGLTVRMDQPMAQLGGRWIELVPPGGTAGVALAPAGGGPSGVDTGIRLSTADAAALHADLREHGVEVSELLLWDGVPPMFSLLDPDGNRLYVSQ